MTEGQTDISYTLTFEDLVAFNRHFLTSSPRHGRLRWMSAIVLWIGALSLVAIHLALGVPISDFTFYTVLTFFVAGLVWVVWLYDFVQLAGVKQAIQTSRIPGKDQQVRLMVDTDGIADQVDDYGHQKVLWPGIGPVAREGGYIFAYISSMQAFILPRRAFPSDEAFDACFSFLKERAQAKAQ